MNYIKIINDNIQTNQMINNWSKARKFKVLQYRFKGCNQDLTECYLQNPNTQKIYTIRENDFQFLENYWTDYNNNAITRHELRNLNRSTTYTICLMHYLEINNLLNLKK